MALLHIPPSGGDILVVGDGNFSFSLCLAAALSKANFHHTIVATSLDRREQLVNNGFAQGNLDIISSFSDVEIIHGVDATDLACSFGSRKFGRVIFNFPHTGGKSNIKKSRQLLADFFASAVGHILPVTGEACVSLCQGQGGTPEDKPQRGYGNTWQVVEQAAKADLMLKSILSFTSSEYPQYKSAGFRGLLYKGFHTIGGLTHTFVHGTPLIQIPEFGEGSVAVTNCRHKVPTHPICLIRKKLEAFFTELSAKDPRINGFEICTPPETEDHSVNKQEKVLEAVETRPEFYKTRTVNHVKAKECKDNLASLASGETSSQNCPKQHKYFSQQVTEKLENTTGSFIITDSITHFSLPVTKNIYPTTEHMAVVRRDNCFTVEQLIAELDDIIGMFIKEICPNIETFLNKIEGNADEQDQITNERFLTQQCGPPDRMFKLGHNDDDDYSIGSSQPVCSNTCVVAERFCLHSGDSGCTNTRIHDSNFPCPENCDLCRHELKYSCEVIQESSKWVSAHLTKPKSHHYLVYKEKVLVTYGFLRGRVTGVNPTEYPPGWIIEVNLDALLMALYAIPDSRLLHSCDPKFVEQFASIQEPDRAFHFTPFNLYAPSYTHDISFWLETGTIEEQFLQAIYRLTQNCVQDVLFKERYYDRDSGQVSYNYRMIYSRCDGPMTHLHSVKMQNLLRRNLMALGFGLK